MRKCFLNPIMENTICKAVKDKNTNPGALTTLSKIGSTIGDVKAIKYCHNLPNITNHNYHKRVIQVVTRV